jgi:hypothetical protein
MITTKDPNATSSPKILTLHHQLNGQHLSQPMAEWTAKKVKVYNVYCFGTTYSLKRAKLSGNIKKEMYMTLIPFINYGSMVMGTDSTRESRGKDPVAYLCRNRRGSGHWRSWREASE